MEENTQGMAPKKADPKDLEENKGITFLSYIGILSLIPLLSKKDSEFAQYHAKQGVVLFLCMFLAWIPFIGWILGLTLVVFAIMGLMNVAQGEMKPLPIVGDLAKKINL